VLTKILFEPGPGLALLFGYHEENLRQLESSIGVRITAKGNEVTVKGPRAAVEAASRLLRQMRDRKGALSHAEVNGFTNGREEPRHDGGVAGHEPVRTPRLTIVPRGPRQEEYVRSIRTTDVTFGVGPAGTGKTYLAVGCALAAFSAGAVSRIILVRPVVEAGERLGFLPGDVREKVNPYMRPLYDALQDMIELGVLRRLMEEEVIEIAPLAYMRGRTLNKAFIILDEAQNTTVEQMKMFLTRMGVGSRAVITGDITQIDLPRETASGLVHAARLLGSIEGISIVYFLPGDVVRHELVRRILVAYEERSRVTRPEFRAGRA
jgi:phosphate starvation-inducible PhoH-like protein